MKKLVTSIVALVMISVIATAQISSTTNNNTNKKHHKGHKKSMLNGVDLTTEQKTAMQKIKADHKTKMEALKKNDAITLGDFRAKKEALSKEHKAQVDNVLTNAQKATLAQNKATHKKGEGKQGGHHKGGHGKDKMKKISSELELTEVQKAALKETKAKSKAAKAVIENDAKLTAAEKKVKLDTLKTENKKAFEATLTNEQKTKLATMKQYKGKRKPISK